MSDSWSSLRALLIDQFPYPIACAFAQYAGNKSDSLKLDHILYTAESLLQFVGSVVLLDGFEELRLAPGPATRETPPEMPRDVKALFDAVRSADLQAPGIGLWQYALVRILPRLRNCSLPELSSLVQNKPAWDFFCSNLDNLKNERNGLGHPWRRISDETVHKLLPDIEQMFFGIADALQFLSNYCFAAVIECRERGALFEVTLKLLTGEHQASEPVVLTTARLQQARDIVLISMPGASEPLGRALILNPLYCVYGALEEKELGIYAYHRPFGELVGYYCVDDPDRTLRLGSSRDLGSELRDPSRDRRRDLRLSAADLRLLRESTQKYPVPIGSRFKSGKVVNERPSGRPSSGKRSSLPPTPISFKESAVEQELPRQPPVQDQESLPEPIVYQSGNARSDVSEQTARPRRRGLVMVSLALALAVGGGGLYLTWPLNTPGPYFEPTRDGSVNEALDASLVVDAQPPDLLMSVVELPWTIRASGTQLQLFGVWGDGAQLRVAVGEQGVILVSEDGGAGWQPRTSSGSKAALLYAVAGSTNGTIFAVGRFGTIVRSRDSGKTWAGLRDIPTNETLMGIYAGDGKHIFAVGDHGTVLRSDNDGDGWAKLSVPVGTLLRGIWGRSGATDLYATGWDGVIVHSQDGLNFQRVQAQTNAWLWGGYSDPESGVFVVGKEGRVLRSLDHGKTFRPVVTGHPTALTSIWGNGQGDLWITGQAGIFHSEDRGANWVHDKSGALLETRRKLNQIWGSPTGELLAVGDGGTIIQRVLSGFPRPATSPANSGVR